MLIVRLAGGRLCVCACLVLSLVVSLVASFCAVLFLAGYLGWGLGLNWVSF